MSQTNTGLPSVFSTVTISLTTSFFRGCHKGFALITPPKICMPCFGPNATFWLGQRSMDGTLTIILGSTGKKRKKRGWRGRGSDDNLNGLPSPKRWRLCGLTETVRPSSGLFMNRLQLLEVEGAKLGRKVALLKRVSSQWLASFTVPCAHNNPLFWFHDAVKKRGETLVSSKERSQLVRMEKRNISDLMKKMLIGPWDESHADLF